jgi:hypothetical protein
MTPFTEPLTDFTLSALVPDAWRIVARQRWPEWDMPTAPNWDWTLTGAEIATLRRLRGAGARNA